MVQLADQISQTDIVILLIDQRSGIMLNVARYNGHGK